LPILPLIGLLSGQVMLGGLAPWSVLVPVLGDVKGARDAGVGALFDGKDDGLADWGGSIETLAVGVELLELQLLKTKIQSRLGANNQWARAEARNIV
jgi:hypothetical protein